MKYLIKNGKVVDPANNLEEELDVIISDGRISKIGKRLDGGQAEIVDAKGLIVAPGLVDMHTHLREPGREDEETVGTGTRAAVKGGYTTVACMPNTETAIDSPEAVNALRSIIEKDALCNVIIVGAITKGRLGKELTDIAGLKKAGAAALSDDGASLDDEALMAGALELSKREGMLLIEHCEDAKLSRGGVINKGLVSTKMGLRGISRESEYERVGRNLEFARRAGSRIHIAHVSCKESVELIRKAKAGGVLASAETAPHYFTLNEECCVTYDTNTKMNPPLRTSADVEAIKRALADGTIDAIATDHAPHTDSEKDVEFDFAPFGIIGLETALSLALMELVEPGVLSIKELILKMSVNPARLMGAGKGGIKEGAQADIVIIDPAAEYVYKKDSIESKSKNSPFIGWKLKGKALFVFTGGALKVKNGTVMISEVHGNG